MNARVVVVAVLLLTGCSSAEKQESVEARAVPESQSDDARALRLPRMSPASVATAQAGAAIATLRVQVVFDGPLPPDTTVQARTIDPTCGESFVDTAVVHNGNAIVGALVWVEGTGTVISTAGVAEFRPSVVLEGCRLQPRVQLAAPGSTIQLVAHDQRVESLVIVPSSPSTPIDTITFITDGQLVPVRHRTDSVGVLGIYATRLPWARAFVAITPVGVSAITDANGAASFTLNRAATKLTIRAWHPSLGVAVESLNPSSAGAAPAVTLTFRR